MTRHLTIERTTLIILFIMLFALATRVQVDTDMWWHLRTGQWQIENQEVVRVDHFSHTFTGEPRTHYEWFAQIILYGLWSLGGDFALSLFTATLATGGMAFLYRSSEGNTYLRAFAMILGASASAVFWSARPQMFSFFFSTVVIWILYLYKRKQTDRLWLLPLLFLIWAQLHVGWSIGLIILGGTIAGEILNNLLKSKTDHIVSWQRGPRLVVFSVLSGLVLLINPYGLDLLLVPFQTVSIGPLTQYIQEWNPPDFAMPEVWPFVTLLILTALLMIRDWRKLDWTEVILAGGSAFLAVNASRNISFFAVVATPIVTYHLNALLIRRGWTLQTVKRPSKLMVRINVLLIVLIAVGAFANLLVVADPEMVADAKAMTLPVGAIEYVNEEQPPGAMFNSYNWGGYIMFHAQDYPVFIDGRTDLYRDFVLDWVRLTTAGANWREDFETFGINLVIVETNVPLSDALRDEPGWTLAYEDEVSVVFTRDETHDSN